MLRGLFKCIVLLKSFKSDSKTLVTSNMGIFMIAVNDVQLLPIDTKSSILDITGVFLRSIIPVCTFPKWIKDPCHKQNRDLCGNNNDLQSLTTCNKRLCLTRYRNPRSTSGFSHIINHSVVTKNMWLSLLHNFTQ